MNVEFLRQKKSSLTLKKFNAWFYQKPIATKKGVKSREQLKRRFKIFSPLDKFWFKQ